MVDFVRGSVARSIGVSGHTCFFLTFMPMRLISSAPTRPACVSAILPSADTLVIIINIYMNNSREIDSRNYLAFENVEIAVDCIWLGIVDC